MPICRDFARGFPSDGSVIVRAMTRAERYDQIKPLRDAGLTWREIGERLGIALQTAQQVYTDPTGEQAAARKAQYSRPCTKCGAPTNPGGKQETGGRCKNCVHADPVERFWAKVDKREADECWLWLGAKGAGRNDKWGLTYGNFSIGGIQRGPHRFSYELHVGPIPKGMVIDHVCCNSLCVNPGHLEVVTKWENYQRGKVRAGSRITVRETVPWATVEAIRAEYAVGDTTQRALAAKYEVSATYVSHVVNMTTRVAA